MVDGFPVAGAELATSSGGAHAHVARCILAMARVLVLGSANELASPEARALAQLTSEAARQAADAAGRPIDLLIGRSSLQLQGEALRAPSWVYDAAWSIASRLAPGSICALHVPASVEPEDVLELARTGSPGPSTRIRSFRLPGHFAALVEAQGREPGLDERLAVSVLGIRKELGAAREKNHGSMQLWTSLARSLVESCEQQPRWRSIGTAHALEFDREAWLAADAALLAGCMTQALSSARRASCDAVLAVLLVTARRAWDLGPVAFPRAQRETLQDWVLSARDSDQVPPTCLVLLGELDHLVTGDVPAGACVCRADSVLARIVECSWWFAQAQDRRGLGIDNAGGDGVLALLRACTAEEPTVDSPASDRGVDAAHVADKSSRASATPDTMAGGNMTKPFTDDELDSFLDEFVEWGGRGGG